MNQPDEQLEFINVGGAGGAPLSGGGGFDSGAGGAPGGAGVGGFIRQSRHPVAALFHFLFKALAVLTYVFGTWFSSNFIFLFVLCVLLLAADFWTVKNVTGRLLVGLRWWSHVSEDGKTDWVFESLEDLGEVHAGDARLFWLGLYATPAAWAALFVVGLLKFNLQWLIVVVVALALSGANIIGYTKCRKDAKQKLQGFVESGVTGLMASEGFRNTFLSFFTGGGSNTNQRGGAGSEGNSAYV
mmetsp:Transcript_31770/g.51810  ORF Transcript_31770/g.51810 Transcript_31770/m.51810 type:complete len:242 (+) Transcript_31770:178-903(+)|eukprot:CAMPEP_0194589924 /NCGR_PEP_ID=MMETSP0292-20121207/20977_1 /TAXON_ID=39354 /ORGANISM="Heterosigma akashiwo, Strain CCMP2393" /LENGTH=241 /DNA_ID=CAMNT_0039447335 /DNA_START=163 /DNA_END=888 /DNA_ORIENTATION=+